MQPKSCSSELPYDSVSEQDFVLVHQSKLKKNMFYCIELNLRTRWSVGRSVGQSVGRPVGLSVYVIISSHVSCSYPSNRLICIFYLDDVEIKLKNLMAQEQFKTLLVVPLLYAKGVH